jgi:ubiquinone/menaquinone biosynthesis C-methylase UbiE
MGSPSRLQREIEHHRRIADHAEMAWNWNSPSGLARADRRAAFFVERGGLAPGRRALELGCGTGVFLTRVARSGATLVGLDLSQDLLARAHEQLKAIENVRLACGNAEAMPFADGGFDTVYGSSVLHHLGLARALAESFRLVRPGGRVVFTEPNIVNPQVFVMFRFGWLKDYFAVSPDEMAFTRFRARRALLTAGFSEIEVRPFDFLHPATPASWMSAVGVVGRSLEQLPLVREIAGSMLIVARRPA